MVPFFLVPLLFGTGCCLGRVLLGRFFVESGFVGPGFLGTVFFWWWAFLGRVFLGRFCLGRFLLVPGFVGSGFFGPFFFGGLSLRCFVSKDGNSVKRKVLLRCLPNGFYGDHEFIIVYLETFEGLEEASMKKKIAGGIVQALLHRIFRQLIRAKWGATQLSVCDVGLSQVCFGLLVPAFERFALRLQKKKAISDDPSPDDHTPCLPDGGAADPDENDGFADEPTVSAGSHVKDNAKGQREKLSTRLRRSMMLIRSMDPSPAAFFILTRNVVSSLDTLVQKHCFLTSRKYELRQQARAVKAKERGDELFTRHYPVTVLAAGVLEQQCLEKLQSLLFQPTLWMLLLPADMTNRNRLLAFRMISSSGAVVQPDIALVNASFPIQAYSLIHQPELAERMLATPVCLRGEWFDKFCNTSVLGSRESQLRLVTHAMLLQGNTVPQEVNNAQLRRIVKSRPQCKQIDLGDLSVQAVGTDWKSRYDVEECVPTSIEAESGIGADADDEHEAKPKKRAKRGKGGAMHAFAHEAGINNFKEMHGKYAALTDEEKERYIAAGKEATAMAREGLNAYGPTRRAIKSAQRRRQIVVALDKYKDMDKDDAIETLINDAVRDGHTLQDVASITRRLEMALMKQDRDMDRKCHECLADYARTNTTKDVKDLKVALPGASKFSDSLVSLPPVCGAKVFERKPSAAVRDVALVQSTLAHYSQSHGLNLGGSLDYFWKLLHCLIKDCTADELPGEDHGREATPPTDCFKYGLCLCAPGMHKLVLVRNRLFRIAKTLFHKDNPADRKLFLGGFLILRISWHADDTDGEDTIMDWSLCARYFHVSRVRLSPYELYLQPMEIASESERVMANAQGLEIAFKASVYRR